MLGMRDDLYRRQIGVPTIAGQVRLITAADLHQDPAQGGRKAALQVASRAPGWWLHIDFDVLDRKEFSACGAPGWRPAYPGQFRGSAASALLPRVPPGAAMYQKRTKSL
jgi:arginase family enzyme